ncbi:hypothetical protein HK098_005393 [Nowakowskiella sp. JEL0407]|nr:hypothetical protein HK098_005393 [Nowakowskiella sp. JEL0407]
MANNSRILVAVLLVIFIASLLYLNSEQMQRFSLTSSSCSQLQTIESSLNDIKAGIAKISVPQQAAVAIPVPAPAPTDRAGAFTDIFVNNVWGSSESRSGLGSTMAYTVQARLFMSTMFKIFKPKSFLDSPCGDCNWQPSITGIENVLYTGVDIVPNVVLQNAKKYIGNKNMRFVNLDLVTDLKSLPKNQFDIALCRDAIQHLPLEDGMEIYKGFQEIGIKILVTNIVIPSDNSLNPGQNINVVPGSVYANNPLLPPFNFSLPLFYIPEHVDGFLNSLKILAAFELPSLGKGPGTYDPAIFDISLPYDKVNPIGKKAEALLKGDGSSWKAHFFINSLNDNPNALRPIATVGKENSPVPRDEITGESVICGIAKPFDAFAKTPAVVAAGSIMKIHWTNVGAFQQPTSTDAIGANHYGICHVYIGQGLKPNGWSKLYETTPKSSNDWCLNIIAKKNNNYYVPIPSVLKAGDYVLRVELIALHEPGNPQFYVRCMDVKVTGSGERTPSFDVKIPGAWDLNTAGLTYNIYNKGRNATDGSLFKDYPDWGGSLWVENTLNGEYKESASDSLHRTPIANIFMIILNIYVSTLLILLI